MHPWPALKLSGQASPAQYCPRWLDAPLWGLPGNPRSAASRGTARYLICPWPPKAMAIARFPAGAQATWDDWGLETDRLPLQHTQAVSRQKLRRWNQQESLKRRASTVPIRHGPAFQAASRWIVHAKNWTCVVDHGGEDGAVLSQ